MPRFRCTKCRFSSSERLAELRRLRKETNEAIKAARIAGIEDAVNWGDLSCVEAALVLTDEGRSCYRVMIEEAAPETNEFRRFINDYLAEHGWPNVEVVAEW